VRPNPFHVLSLPVDATTEEVVERSHERAELAESDEERHLVVEAQRELITNPATRLSHELLEAPATDYRDQQWRTFEHRNRRPPVDCDALMAAAVPLRRTDVDVHALITTVLENLLRGPDVDVRPALAAPPVRPPRGEPPLEVRDVLFG
jgi:hypothetical protein